MQQKFPPDGIFALCGAISVSVALLLFKVYEAYGCEGCRPVGDLRHPRAKYRVVAQSVISCYTSSKETQVYRLIIRMVRAYNYLHDQLELLLITEEEVVS